MKDLLRRTLFLFAALMLLLSACGTNQTSTPVVSIEQNATEPPVATEPPSATEAPTEAVIPIDLGGPVMEVGATYRYVDGSTLVAVPGGKFIMGYGSEENLEHEVMLGDFWIYREEVTNSQYALCVLLGKCSPPYPEFNANYGKYERRNDPVTGVRWDQAQAYCDFVKGRLPTEAEWEKTARGPNGNVYPWGDAAPNCDLANVGRCNDETTEVTKYPKGASFYGAGNMVGNVFEWVGDWYEPQYYKVSPADNPPGPETGVFRSVRSSMYNTEFYLSESARRFREYPERPRVDLGFRCVVEEPALFAPWCEQVAFTNPTPPGGPEEVNIPASTCPNVSVTTGGYCDKTVDPPIPGALLDYNPDPLPAGALVTYPVGCVPDGTTADPNDYNCTGAGGEGPATVQGLCIAPPAPPPAGCAPGYTQVGNTCQYSGGLTGRECLPGITYDPATQCCQAIPGGSDSYSLCPVSAPYYSFGVCQQWPVNEYGPLVTVSVGFGSCEDNPGTNNGCTVTPATCQQLQMSFNLRLCCCTRIGSNVCVYP